MPNPVRFVFGLHLHQPIGNFDGVFEQHLSEVYRPLLERVDERDFFPIVLHLSGPLLEWLENHDSEYLDRVGRLVADRKVELLLAGMYEPVLAALPRADRVEQIVWMREALAHRFGVNATGLWLTERVWQPELAADLAQAGVRYAVVDDRHFLITGFSPEQLHVPYLTESDGHRVTLFPIHERLRYLIPFRPPAETAQYLRDLRAQGRPLAVLADDGEKFGGWPGTREWVYDRGWLDQFLTTMAALTDGGEVLLSTFGDALEQVPPGGLAYLPTASYREMEAWALPAPAARRLAALEQELGETRMQGPDGALVRGTHWLNFMVKYPEANRMHKKMVALSARCRAAGDPPEVRRAIGRAQCNDAYWHGVFGGLYLPHLRDAVWAELARAEGQLRAAESPTWELDDLDADGHEELWLHDPTFSAIVSPGRGGVVEEFTVFAHEINYANVLTRQREGYHVAAEGRVSLHDEGGTPSIHDLESRMQLNELPPIDPAPRVFLRERVLPAALEEAMYRRGDYDPLWEPGLLRLEWKVEAADGGLALTFRAQEAGVTRMEKRYHFRPGGRLAVDYRWQPAAFDPGTVFAPELSYAGPMEITCSPAAPTWSHEIITTAKSERALEQTVQGSSVTPRWPIDLGSARMEIVAKGR